MAATPGVIFAGKPTQVETGTHNGARNKPNEDRFDAFVGPGNNGQPAQFLIVADGVTSTHGGERASDIAVRVLRRLLQSPATSSRAPKPLRARLAEAINAANQEILETARKDPDLKGMSTTLVVAAIDGDQLTLMHLGDSRAYLIRSGKAYQLTRDHTWVQDAMDEGRITPEQARTHPNRHVIQRYLGDARGVSIDDSILDPARPLENPDQTEMSGPTPRPSDTTLTLRPGDALLLCSDGLYNRISDEEIAAAATKYAPEKAVRSLIEQAVKRDEPDNITIVFWPTGGAPAVAAAAAARRPTTAIALAAAGIVLALAAVWFIMSQSGGEQAGPPPAGEVAVVASPSPEVAAALPPPAADTPTNEQATETPTVAPSDTATTPAMATALPTATSSAQSTDVGAPPITPLPTAGSAGEAAIPLPPTVTAVVDGQQSAPAATLTAAAMAVAEAQAQATADAATSVAADPMQTLAATVTPAAGARATSTPISTPTVSPTPTSTLTRTPQPTRTPTPATTGAAPTPAVAGSASGGVDGPRTATILQPADNHSSNTPTLFSWRADGELAPGQEFEVVFFNPGTQKPDDGGSWVRSDVKSSVMIPADKAAPGTYGWALYLVRPQPYQKLRMLAGPFTFSVPGSGGEQKPEDAPQPTNTPVKNTGT